MKLLETKYVVRKTPKSLTAKCVPLAILGQASGLQQPDFMAKSLLELFHTTFRLRQIDFFVVEMGVDKPGDMTTS